MRAVIQRVSEARVTTNGQLIGAIGPGLLVLLGIAKEDTLRDADYVLDKVLGLRLFDDSQGKMNLSIRDTAGGLLIVSQFTLYGDCRKGRRPSFDRAAKADHALAMYDYFVAQARSRIAAVETGVFRASMQVSLVNNGPVTIICDSADAPGR